MSASVSLKGDVTRKNSKPWAGRVVSALPVLMLAMSASMKLAHPPKVVDMFVQHLGYSESALLPLALVELACMLLYLVPRTRVLGAVLLTGYFGGAIATHLRVGDPFFVPLLLGILVWVGLYLRDPRVRALATLRGAETS
jgi:DoxX-like family